MLTSCPKGLWVQVPCYPLKESSMTTKQEVFDYLKENLAIRVFVDVDKVSVRDFHDLSSERVVEGVKVAVDLQLTDPDGNAHTISEYSSYD